MSDDLSDRICSRCLVILNVTSHVEDLDTNDSCPHPTDMRFLRRWVEEHMWGMGHRLSIDAMPNAFDPVGTWHGDAVCWNHLVECRQREWGLDDRSARRH